MGVAPAASGGSIPASITNPDIPGVLIVTRPTANAEPRSTLHHDAPPLAVVSEVDAFAAMAARPARAVQFPAQPPPPAVAAQHRFGVTVAPQPAAEPSTARAAGYVLFAVTHVAPSPPDNVAAHCSPAAEQQSAQLLFTNATAVAVLLCAAGCPKARFDVFEVNATLHEGPLQPA